MPPTCTVPVRYSVWGVQLQRRSTFIAYQTILLFDVGCAAESSSPRPDTHAETAVVSRDVHIKALEHGCCIPASIIAVGSVNVLHSRAGWGDDSGGCGVGRLLTWSQHAMKCE